MPGEFALALPRKRFFVEMFTRDISLDDCVLDLIDNSVDAYIRQKGLDLRKELLHPAQGDPSDSQINVTLEPSCVSIVDTCGGIELAKARTEIFNFGHSSAGAQDLTQRGIGAYGIGLKRAIFKIGRRFEVASRQNGTSFTVNSDLDEWIMHDSELSDWQFPLTEGTATGLIAGRAGTRVTIEKLLPHISKLLEPGSTFIDDVRRSVSRTYSPFLNRFLVVSINQMPVDPDRIPLGYSQDTGLSSAVYEDDGVAVRLVAGPAARGPRDEWPMEKAGWYVLCNGRVVLAADKTETTGWGAGILPQFHSSKGRGFVGIALFSSDDPLKLPWTTTKRGLNRESPVFIRARNRMQSVARPVYQYLESLYPSGSDATVQEREVAETMVQAEMAQVLAVEASQQFVERRARKSWDVVTISYKAKKDTVAAIKKRLNDTRMPNGRVGLHTFNYFVQQEGVDEGTI